jgi:hypothetical protein
VFWAGAALLVCGITVVIVEPQGRGQARPANGAA